MRKLQNSELGRPNPERYQTLKKIPIIVILDNVRSLHNIGSVFRTSDAFLVEEILLCGITATPPHPELYKTALGAEKTVTWQYFDDTLSAIDYVTQAQYIPIGIEQTEKSIPLHRFPFDTNHRYALIFGHEVKGVQQAVINQCQLVIEIPQYGTKHSLNIAVSTGIVLWDFFKALYRFQ